MLMSKQEVTFQWQKLEASEKKYKRIKIFNKYIQILRFTQG